MENALAYYKEVLITVKSFVVPALAANVINFYLLSFHCKTIILCYKTKLFM